MPDQPPGTIPHSENVELVTVKLVAAITLIPCPSTFTIWEVSQTRPQISRLSSTTAASDVGFWIEAQHDENRARCRDEM